MNDDFAAPVKGILKAYDTGIKLARRVSKSAGSATAAQGRKISESALNLESSLEGSSQAIIHAYRQSAAACGEPFTRSLIDDQSIQTKLKDLRIDLIDQINECQDLDEDPESFNPTAFTNVEEQAGICCAECIALFNHLRDQLPPTFRNDKLDGRPQDDRAQLSSMRGIGLTRKPIPSPSYSSPPAPTAPLNTIKPTQALETLPTTPAKPRSPWSIDSPSQFDLGSSNGSLQSSPRHLSRDISPASRPTENAPRLIPRDVVNYRVNANEEFLERRKQSRQMFQNEMHNSTVSSEENRASPPSGDGSILSSPEWGYSKMASSANERNRVCGVYGEGTIITTPIMEHSAMVGSPIERHTSRASSNGYDALLTRQRSQGNASQMTRSSRNSSIVQDHLPERPRHDRQDSQASQESIFGLRAAPLSPPLSEHRTSATEHWGALATTLRVPGFGQGVEDGLEAVSNIDYDNGLMLVNENEIANQPTPTTSLKTADYPMRHDSSFYKFGGFCEGAKAVVRGETGFKIVKRPSGHYSATVSARCIKCSYEVGWNDVERDRLLDRAGIYGNCGIRFRQKFVSKCHLRTQSLDEPIYGCIFCIEEHKTVEVHDATVFFSVGQLFRHLAKHSWPLPHVAGISTIYGPQPASVLNFDIHFTTPEPKFSQYSMREIASKIASRPSAHALTTHNPKSSRSSARDPEGQPTLHFAVGAHIVGITFPDRFNGQWCVGYHDGERGSFPASAIMLELPAKEDVLMSTQNNLVAVARWDFKPKEAKDGGWLKFSKGDKVTAIGYTFQDQWCWSGQTSKGKWGLFPAAFVEHLQEAGKLATSPASVKGGGLGSFGSRIGSFPIGRHKSSRHERNGSVNSTSSGGSGGAPMVAMQPGLEVVQSPIHAYAHGGSLRR